MSKCPTRQTTKEVSDQTVLDNQTLQELLVRNRHDTTGTGCCKLEVCEVMCWLSKTDDNDRTHKNDAKNLS